MPIKVESQTDHTNKIQAEVKISNTTDLMLCYFQLFEELIHVKPLSVADMRVGGLVAQYQRSLKP